MITGRVFDIKRFAIHDGPGIRTTVFFQGCPLRCIWCHNPEGLDTVSTVMLFPDKCVGCNSCLDACNRGAISAKGNNLLTDRNRCIGCGRCAKVCPSGARKMVGRTVTTGEVIGEIERDVIFYDQSGGGATFSGGEPLMQPKFLMGLLSGCKERSIDTLVDTSGYVPLETLLTARGYVDTFYYDLKIMDPQRHKELTGVDNQLILDNLRVLAGCHDNVVVRVPIIPGINDDVKSLAMMTEYLIALETIRRVDILPYHRTGSAKYGRLGKEYSLDIEPPGETTIQEIADCIRQEGFTVKVGG